MSTNSIRNRKNASHDRAEEQAVASARASRRLSLVPTIMSGPQGDPIAPDPEPSGPQGDPSSPNAPKGRG